MEEKKTGGWKNAVIVLLLIVVLVLGGYICYEKAKGSNKCAESHETKKDEESKKEEKPTEENIYIINSNEKLSKLNILLHFALDFEYDGAKLNPTKWFLPKNVQYNTELFDTETKRVDFVYGYLATSGIEGVQRDVEATGDAIVPLSLLKKYYKDMFELELKDASSYTSNEYGKYDVKDGKVYGAFWSGIFPLGTTLKYKSFTEENGVYTLIADVIVYDDDYSYDYNDVSEYDEDDVTEYPQEIVAYKLQVKLVKVDDDLYTIKSMQIIK